MNKETQTNAEIQSTEKQDFEFRANGQRRSPTVLKLQWLAERLRKVNRIKEQVEKGTYSVDSTQVSKAILGGLEL